MSDQSRTPSYDELSADLSAVRKSGIGRIRSKHLPALIGLAHTADLLQADDDEPAAITVLLRQAVDELGGGSLQEAAEYSLGLYPGTALWPADLRRERAAMQFGVVADTFRKRHEKELLDQIADALLVIAQGARLRQASAAMVERRHPADSRLAVQWVERFEAYYRIWTPAYALAADLEAALDTYLEEPTDHLPWDPNSAERYDPIKQAQGYGHSALYWLAQFHLEVKRFRSRHGGMWLLSDAQAEQDAADAVCRIGWHNPLSDGDEAFLRRHLADSRHEEPDHFWQIISAFPDGKRINDLWQNTIRDGVGPTQEQEKSSSQVWSMVTACHDYCRLIDDDWLKIADWYRPGVAPNRNLSGAALYDGLVNGKKRQGHSAPSIAPDDGAEIL